MPMKTTCVTPGCPSATVAAWTASHWPMISLGVRLRDNFIVPVAQKVQPAAQPTWLERHSVPRSPLGIQTDSMDSPSRRQNRNFMVPSTDR